MKKAIVLFSGGLDSTTCLAIAQKDGYICHALSFDYGQRHAIELENAKEITKKMCIEHRIINLDTQIFAGNLLTDKNAPLPDFEGTVGLALAQQTSDSKRACNKTESSIEKSIAPTYVPARNTIFLAYALAYAENIDADAIYIGTSAVDYSGYPDCRPEFIKAFQKLADLATKKTTMHSKIKIFAPLIALSKAATIKLGIHLGVNYQGTVSCYQANENGEACGRCDSCGLRKEGFKAANIADPTKYTQDIRC